MLKVANQSRRFKRRDALNLAPDVRHAVVRSSAMKSSILLIIGMQAVPGESGHFHSERSGREATRTEVATFARRAKLAPCMEHFRSSGAPKEVLLAQ